MRKVRVSSWEMDGHLFAAVEAAKAKRGNAWTWRRMQSEGLRLLLASWGEPVIIATDDESGEVYAHAPNVERVPAPAVATQAAVPAVGVPAVGVPAVGVPAVGVPAVGVPAVGVQAVELSPNAKRLINLKAGLARKQATLSAAYEELKADPASLRANNLVKRIPDDIADSERLILEVGALVEAEEAAEETTGGVAPGEEV